MKMVNIKVKSVIYKITVQHFISFISNNSSANCFILNSVGCTFIVFINTTSRWYPGNISDNVSERHKCNKRVYNDNCYLFRSLHNYFNYTYSKAEHIAIESAFIVHMNELLPVQTALKTN